MVLSDRIFKPRIISEATAKEWWADDRWDVIGDQILIYPAFPKQRLGVIGYEIGVGEQYTSLRDPYNVHSLAKGESVDVGPGETVLILTEEFIGLPKSVVGLIVPRARRIFEGGLINATRLDPTWYGKLIIGFTNLAKHPVALRRSEPFCVCIFFETAEVEKTLKEERTEHLGRERLEVDFPHLRYHPPRSPETVSAQDLQRVVEQYGTPFDIVIGDFHQMKAKLLAQVERDIAPNVVRQAVSEAKTSAFGWLLVLLGALIVAFIGLLAKLANLF
jgi:deoxycytidine triphosphate deaminase